MIDFVIDPRRDTIPLPGNTHTYGSGGWPKSALMMRSAMSVIVSAEPGDIRDDLERILRPEDHRRGEYGLILVESQVFSATALVDPELVDQFRAGRIDVPQILPRIPIYGGWPAGEAWENALPRTTWHPDGVGVLETLPADGGGTVTVYECMVDEGQMWSPYKPAVGRRVPMVLWHCDRCHRPYGGEIDERFENRRPGDREWVAQRAWAHARNSSGECAPPTGRAEQAISEAMSEYHGRRVQLPPREVSCAADGGCAEVRAAREATSRLAR